MYIVFTFILFIIVVLGFGVFATQNTQSITITFANYTISQVPLYIVLGVSLLIGLIVSSIGNLPNVFSAAMRMRGKEHAIKSGKSTINQLEKKIDQLEAENTRLKDEIKNKSQIINKNTSFTDKIKNMWPKS